MSELHDLCKFATRPGAESVAQLQHFLRAGIPATYTIEEAYNYTHGIEAEPTTTTTPLHLICTHVPADCTAAEMAVVGEMLDTLFEYGAGWCLADVNGETPGCILVRRQLQDTPLYARVVDAGVRAELLLRKVSEFDMEVIDDTEDVDHEAFGNVQVETKEEEEKEEREEKKEETSAGDFDPSHNQEAYLLSKLTYTDGALLTDQQDGVMMEWETELMRLGCESLFSSAEPEACVLNIGFGMGIIDTMISEKKPAKHYICEAHPDVLAKLRQDGWYDRPNVVILEGRWQDQLDGLLSSGLVYFDGIYYDTFSEHYQDMLELFDYVVGLLKPTGTFLFFNGLGADRQVVYDVYRKLVEIDLASYGLKCTFKDVEVPAETMKKHDKSVWDGVRRSYWLCPTFYHPEARFMDF